MDAYTMETIARQRMTETAGRAEAMASRGEKTKPRRRWARVAWAIPTMVHVATKEAR